MSHQLLTNLHRFPVERHLVGGLVNAETNDHIFGCCNEFAWSQEGQFLATYYPSDNHVYIADTTIDDIINDIELKPPVYALTWSSDNQLYYVGYHQGDLVLQSAETDEVLINLNFHDRSKTEYA